MATFDYTPIRAKAIELIKKFGRPTPVQIVRTVNGTPPDTSKPWRVGAASALTFQTTAVVLPYEQRSERETDTYAIIYVPGDVIDVPANEDNTKTCGTIEANDIVVTGDAQYTIAGKHDLTPGDAPIFFKLRCKAWPLDIKQPSTGF